MLKLIRNNRGEVVLGIFLVLLFFMFVGGKVAEDHKGDTAPAIVNTIQGEAPSDG